MINGLYKKILQCKKCHNELQLTSQTTKAREKRIKET